MGLVFSVGKYSSYAMPAAKWYNKTARQDSAHHLAIGKL